MYKIPQDNLECAPFAAIVSKYADWREFLVKRLTGARTLPINFYAKLWSTIRSQFRPGMKLEVVDKMRICQVNSEWTNRQF